uniref:Uncharacterized protein n=1 Tax=Arundo donax TaxID=35708 RepID=A0A0A8YT91_ARUDO
MGAWPDGHGGSWGRRLGTREREGEKRGERGRQPWRCSPCWQFDQGGSRAADWGRSNLGKKQRGGEKNWRGRRTLGHGCGVQR